METMDFSNGWVLFALIAFLIWTFFWKGPALWKSARRGDSAWFVALLLLNTAGILEVLYLFVFSRKKNDMQTGDGGQQEAQTSQSI